MENTNNKIFPPIREVVVSKAKPIYVDRRQAHLYPLVLQYLKNSVEGKSIYDFLGKFGDEKWVLYAVTEFTELICNDLKRQGAFDVVRYICDKNDAKYAQGYFNYRVNDLEQLICDYKAKKINKILVCSYFWENEIFTELMENGVDLNDIISVVSAVYWN